MKLYTILSTVMVSAALLSGCSEEPTMHEPSFPGSDPNDPDARPLVSIWNYDNMLKIRKDLMNHDSQYKPAAEALISEARTILAQTPPSILDRPADIMIFSDDPHDFVSISKYCWPADENDHSVMPWVMKDGYINYDEYNKYDTERQTKMVSNVRTLSLAYFFSGDEVFAQKAVDHIKAWFINPDSRVNPNYDYGQVIPGVNNNKGNTAGVIQGQILVEMLAGVSLIRGSQAYTQEVDRGLKKWVSEMYEWMTTAPIAVKEDVAANNHSVAYDQSLLAYCMFTGNHTKISEILAAFPARRIFAQIEPDGQQPQETRRTLGYHYSYYNVKHFIEICEMAKSYAPYLYSVNQGGRCIDKAVEYIASYADKSVNEWPFQQVSGWESAQANTAWQAYRAHSFNPSNETHLENFGACMVKQPTKFRETNRNWLIY